MMNAPALAHQPESGLFCPAMSTVGGLPAGTPDAAGAGVAGGASLAPGPAAGVSGGANAAPPGATAVCSVQARPFHQRSEASPRGSAYQPGTGRSSTGVTTKAYRSS